MQKVKDKYFKTLIPAVDIQAKVTEIANLLNTDYADKNPLLIGVLNGSFIFLSDLFKCMKIDCEVTFMRVSSYESLRSTGKVTQIIGLKEDISNRHVLIVEDIVDTGQTLVNVKEQLAKLKPASLKVVTLLNKPEAMLKPLPLDYVGFKIKNDFVIGYGLDYDGLGRNLPDICVLAD
ncbi:MAG: hypoxanthine phosphoribosyltransferase [Spirosomaceae bacterium]|nr:hypoxanthine phosphoribosyltransferase [Spirosomataceae bacterium]